MANEVKTVVYKLVAETADAQKGMVGLADRAQAADSVLVKLTSSMSKMASTQRRVIKAQEILGFTPEQIRTEAAAIIEAMQRANGEIESKQNEINARRERNAFKAMQIVNSRRDFANAASMGPSNNDINAERIRRAEQAGLNQYGMSLGPTGYSFEQGLRDQRRRGEEQARAEEQRAANARRMFADEQNRISRSNAMSMGPSRNDINAERMRREEQARLNQYGMSVGPNRQTIENGLSRQRSQGELDARQEEQRQAAIRKSYLNLLSNNASEEKAANEKVWQTLVNRDLAAEKRFKTQQSNANNDRRRREQLRQKEINERQQIGQQRLQNTHYAAQTFTAFAGAEVGGFLGAAGAGGGPFGSGITGAFGGAGMGMSLGMLGGPGGMVAGGLIGGAVGGGLGFLTGAVESVMNLFTMGISKAIDLTKTGATYIIEKGMEYERTLTKFGVLAGGKEQGKALYSSLEQLAIKSPYTTAQTTSGAETLLGYGIKAGDTTNIMSRLGDIAGGDPIRLQRLVLAYGQVASQGKLAGQELRQFAEAGVGANDVATTMGIPVYDLRHRMETTGVAPDALFDTVQRLTSRGGRFNGISGQVNQTVSGQYNALVETAEMAARRVGLSAFEKTGAAGLLGKGANFLSGMAGNADNYGDMLANGLQRAVAFADKLIEVISPGLQKAMGYGERLVSYLEDFANGAMPSWKDFGDTFSNGIQTGAEAFATFVDLLRSAIPMAKALGIAMYGSSKASLGAAYATSFAVDPFNMSGSRDVISGMNKSLDAIFDTGYGGLSRIEKGFNHAGTLTNKFKAVKTADGSLISLSDIVSSAKESNFPDWLKTDTRPMITGYAGNYKYETERNWMGSQYGELKSTGRTPLISRADPSTMSAYDFAVNKGMGFFDKMKQYGSGFSYLFGSNKSYDIDPISALYGGLGGAVLNKAVKAEQFIPKGSLDLINETNTNFRTKGFTSYDGFQNWMNDLNTARGFINPINGRPFMSDQAYQRAQYSAYLDLEKNAGQYMNRLPGTAGYNTSEAVKIMQESMMDTKTDSQKVLEVLEVTKQLHDQEVAYMKVVADVLGKADFVKLIKAEVR